MIFSPSAHFLGEWYACTVAVRDRLIETTWPNTMLPVNRFTNSIVSATSENSASLVEFNLDFSLVKLQPLPEFSPLGSALSTQRRNNAENGELHQLARRLGALFEQLVPSTPKLLKAYGTRASEIISTPGINPKGTKADGPFEKFVGVDGASIWAAATSGPTALAVLLLACILVRKFEDAKTSSAIWAELIFERQKEIEDAIANNEVDIEAFVYLRFSLSRILKTKTILQVGI